MKHKNDLSFNAKFNGKQKFSVIIPVADLTGILRQSIIMTIVNLLPFGIIRLAKIHPTTLI